MQNDTVLKIAEVIPDALDRESGLLNACSYLCGLRVDVKFNRGVRPVKVILWPEAEYFVRHDA